MKSFFVSLVCVATFAVLFVYVDGHGRLLDPPGRSTRWRFNSSAPPNYDDTALYCGGYDVQYNNFGGRCGVCGDSFGDPQPRPNELGGIYGEGVVVKNYGRTGDVTVEITANHLGYIFFELCNVDQRQETEDCYTSNRLRLADGSDRRYIGTTLGPITTTVVFPNGLNCGHCAIRWTYYAGNNWGICEDGSGALGCGPQETFKGCADISVQAAYFAEEALEEEAEKPAVPEEPPKVSIIDKIWAKISEVIKEAKEAEADKPEIPAEIIEVA